MSEQRRKRALVTGGSRRLGRAIVEGLGEHGFDVAVHYRSDERGARDLLDRLRTAGVTGTALQADLGEPEACERLVEAAEDALGGLDLVVNNAAMFDRTPLDTMSVDAVAEFIRVTHEEYAARYDADMGSIIPAIFTDEPSYGEQIHGAMRVP